MENEQAPAHCEARLEGTGAETRIVSEHATGNGGKGIRQPKCGPGAPRRGWRPGGTLMRMRDRLLRSLRSRVARSNLPPSMPVNM